MAVPDRMKDLVELLNNAARAYYNEDTEIMSNLEYDRLYDELLALEAGSGVVLAGSPTQKVGFGVVEGLRKVAHETPLLSLDKTKNVSKLESFLTDGEGILSWKLDGLTVVLTYENGEMIRALTRGNGVIGEEVTHNARVFRNIPLKVGFKGAFAVRGEAVITYSDFERINAELIGAEKYKNPRNLCSGAVRQLNSGVAAGRGVRYIAYTVLRADGADFGDKKENQLGWLASLGFETVEYKVVTRHNIHEWVQWFESRIPESDTPSDGLVLTMNGMDYSRSLGSTSKFPRDSIAFKWADEESETTLLGIEWNTSRTGLINPVAVFEPVEIEGTTVERASLHNVSVLRGLGLGVGDRITVYKANMIIPQVSGNLTRSGAAVIPERCPVCGGPAELDSQAGVEFLRCPNPNCPAQLLRSLAHFASRDAMNIEGLSEQTLEKFIGRGFVSNYADIYGLGKYEAEITQMDGFGAKSFGKLMKAVEKSRSVALPNLINALGIPQVGLANAKLLCGHFRHDIERIMALGPEELIAELDGVRGFGGVISRSVADYFANPENAALLRRLLPLLEIKKPAYIDAYYGLRDIDGLPGAGAAGATGGGLSGAGVADGLSGAGAAGGLSGAGAVGGLTGADATGGLHGADVTGGMSGAGAADGLSGAGAAGGLPGAGTTGGLPEAGGLPGTGAADGLSVAGAAGDLSGAVVTGGLHGADVTGGMSGAGAADGLSGADATGGLPGAGAVGGLTGAGAPGGLPGADATGGLPGAYAVGGLSAKFPFIGKTFVITGSLEKYGNRRELTALIESLGGKVAGSVSAKTDYLINNDSHSASAKNKKAVELGVRVITEEEFGGMA